MNSSALLNDVGSVFSHPCRLQSAHESSRSFANQPACLPGTPWAQSEPAAEQCPDPEPPGAVQQPERHPEHGEDRRLPGDAAGAREESVRGLLGPVG